MLLMLFVTTADAKKPKAPPPPPVNAWGHEEGWKADCFYGADFDKLPDGDRKLARQHALEEMKKQWLGQREDDVKMEDTVVDDVETTLFGRPELIEQVVVANLEQCKAYMKGGPISAWSGWLNPLSGKLTAGECLVPLTYTLFDYLDLGRGWQRPTTICKGNRAHINGTIADKYRITDNGPWITVEGDPAQKAIGADYPCNIEGCYVGMLVGKFVGDDGIETTFPIGADKIFVAPSNGELSWGINDTTWYDNKYFKSASVEDRVAITLEPAE